MPFTADSSGNVTVTVGFSADEGDINRLSSIIEGAVANGFKNFQALMNRLQKQMQEAFNRNSTKGGQAGLKDYEQGVIKLITTVESLGHTISTINEEVKASALLRSKEAIRERAEYELTGQAIRDQAKATAQALNLFQTQAGNERLVALKASSQAALTVQRAELDAVGRVQNQEAQESIIRTRVSGQERVAIVRGFIKQIETAEKGIGAAIKGVATVAEGVTKTIGHAFSTLGGLIHRGNSDFTEGLSTSLRSRESQINESFSRQTRVIEEQITRQAKITTEFRAVTQGGGVIGSASKLGLLGGGLLAGGGIFTAIRSTFRVGSEFTRGLAVLQQQLDLTAAQMVDVRQLSIDLGNDISLPGVSALDAAQAIATLVKQFGSLGAAAPAAAEAAAKGTLQLARASGASAEDAAAVIGAAVNVFGVSADKAVEVADQVTGALTKAAGVGFTEFSDAFKQGASVFANFVVPAEGATAALTDFNASIAILAKSGITGGGAGAALKQFFILGQRTTGLAGKASAEIVKNAGASGTLFFEANGKARVFSDTLDILRKGLVGMTDAQKNDTLIRLFGSRGIQAANALIKTSADDYAALRGAITQQGLAAKIAAAQNAGFKGALDALGSVVETIQILFYEKINPALGKATLFIANLANSIFFANGAWATLRKGLLGALEAIGGLLAFKAVVEVLKLVGFALESILTPMGALIAIAAGLGALINLGIGPFKNWGEAIAFVKDKGYELFTTVESFVLPIFHKVAAFVTGTVVPAIERLGVYLGGKLVTAFHAVSDFITGTAWPALERFGSFLAANFMPVVRTVGDAIVTAFDYAKGKVGEFWTFVHPFIQPAIDGFEKLGSAIAAIFTGGGFSKLGSGALSALGGIGGSLSNIGSSILDALKPIGEKVLRFFKGLFTAANLAKAVEGLSWLVEKIGYILGRIVSDPRLLQVIVVIAAIAVKIGVSFVKGFAEGVIHNLPALLTKIKDLIVAGLTALFDPAVLGKILLGFFAYVGIIAPVIALFRNMGGQAGRSFGDGLKGATKGAGGFLQGLFGGAVSVQASSNSATSTLAGLTKQAQGLTNQIRILGGTKIINPANIDEGKRLVGQLSLGLSDAQIKGLQLRDRISQGFQAFGTVLSGGGGIIKGVGQLGLALVKLPFDVFKGAFNATGRALQNGIADFFGQARIPQAGTTAAQGFTQNFTTHFKSGLSTIASSFKSAVQGVKDYAANTGQSVGAALGKGLATGALAAVGGFTAGQAAGRSGSSGLLTALISGLGAGVVTGNPVIGVIAGVGSLIGSAFGEAAKAAADARARVEDFATAIQTDLKDAIANGTITLIKFRDLLNSGGEGGAVQKTFVDDLSASTQKLLADLKITIPQLLSAFQSGGINGVASLFPLPGNNTDLQNTEVKALIELQIHLKEVNDAIDEANRKRFLLGQSGDDFEHVGQNAQDAQVHIVGALGALQDFATTMATLTSRANFKTAVEGVIARVNADITTLNTNLDLYIAKIKEGFPAGSTAADQAIVATSQITLTLPSFDTSSLTGSAGFRDTLTTLHDKVAEFIQQGVVDGSIKGVDDANAAILPLLAANIQAITLDTTIPEDQKQALILHVIQVYQDLGNNPNITAAAKTAGLKQSDAVLAGLAGLYELMRAAGVNVDQGLLDGIESQRIKIQQKMNSIALEVIGITNGVFQMNSPSKVMHEIGAGVMEGLINGIAAGGDDLASTLTGVVDKAIAQATGAASVGAGTLASIMANIFGQTSGAGAVTGLGGTAGGTLSATTGVTGALQNFLSNFDSVVSSALQVGAIEAAKRTPAQQVIANSSVFSLDPNDVLGAQNVSSLTSALDSIANLGKTLLGSGKTASETTAIIVPYIHQLEEMAKSLGFNSDQVMALVDAFGLSDTALADFLGTVASIPGTINDALNAIPTNKNAGAHGNADGPGGVTGGGDGSGQSTDSTDTPDLTLDQLPRPTLISLAESLALIAANLPPPPVFGPDGTLASQKTDNSSVHAPPIYMTINLPNGDPKAAGLAAANAVARTASILV